MFIKSYKNSIERVSYLKKMKIISIVLILSMILSACGLGSGGTNTNTASQTSTTPEAPAKPTGEATHKLRLSHAANENHPFHTGVVKFVDLVQQKTDGRIQITIYPNRQLGEEKENLENVMNGTLEMALISSSIMSAYTSTFDGLQLPFLLNTYEIEQEAFKTETAQKMLDSLDSLGLKGLGLMEGGMRHLGNNVREIKEPADLEGLKLRVAQTQLMTDIFSTLNASPTPMAYGEVYSALQTGVIDGEETNLSTMYAEKHLEVIKYFTLAGQTPYPAVVLMNNEMFNTIPEEDQKLILEAADEAMEYLFEQIKDSDARALEAIKEKGIQVTELENADEFLEKSQPVYDAYMAKDPLIKEFVEVVDELKK